jgi:hypothetical protein
MNKLQDIAVSLAEAVFGKAPTNHATAQPQVNQAPFEGDAGRIAAAINANVRPSANSPMDHVRQLPKPKPHLLTQPPYVSQAFKAIATEKAIAAGFWDEYDPTALRAYHERDASIGRLHGAIAKLARNTGPDYFANQEEIARKIAAGEPLGELHNWTREDFESNRIERLRATKRRLSDEESAQKKVMFAEMRRKADSIDAFADEVEQHETTHAASWGSTANAPWILMLRKYAYALRNGDSQGEF